MWARLGLAGFKTGIKPLMHCIQGYINVHSSLYRDSDTVSDGYRLKTVDRDSRKSIGSMEIGVVKVVSVMITDQTMLLKWVTAGHIELLKFYCAQFYLLEQLCGATIKERPILNL